MYIIIWLCIFAISHNENLTIKIKLMDEIQQLEFKIVQVEARLYTWKRKVEILEIDSYIDEIQTDKMLDEIAGLKKRIENLKKK